MAYIAPNQNEEENNQDEGSATQENVVAGESGSLGGTSGAAPTAAAANVNTGQSAANRQGFVNLQNYLGANQGHNAQRMANTVGDRVEGSAQQAQQKLGGLQQQYQQDVQQNTIQDNEQLRQTLQYDPTQVAQNQELRDQFSNIYNSQGYQGPQGLGDYGDQYSQVASLYDTAGQSLRNLQTDDGTKQEVQQTYQRPTYNQGELALDNYILRTSDEGRQKLGGLADTYSGISQLLGGQSQELAQAGISAQEQAALAAQTTDQAINALRGTVDETRGQQEQVYRDWLQQTEAENQARQDLQQRVAAGDPTAIMQASGLDKTTVNFLLQNGVSPNAILQSQGMATAGDFADQEQVARMRALEELAGLGALDTFDTSGTSGAFSVDQARADLARQGARFQSDLDKRLAAENAKFQERNQRLYNAVASGTPKQQDAALKELGLTSTEIQQIRQAGVDPVSLITGVNVAGRGAGNIFTDQHGLASDLQYGNIVSDQDRQLYQNLQTMLGIDLGLDLNKTNLPQRSGIAINQDKLRSLLTPKSSNTPSQSTPASAGGSSSSGSGNPLGYIADTLVGGAGHVLGGAANELNRGVKKIFG